LLRDEAFPSSGWDEVISRLMLLLSVKTLRLLLGWTGVVLTSLLTFTLPLFFDPVEEIIFLDGELFTLPFSLLDEL